MPLNQPIPDSSLDEFHPVFRAWSRAWKPADRRTPWEWCQDNVRVDDTSPFPGKWSVETSPWVAEPMEVFADSSVNELAIMCSAQSAKTQTVMCLMMWAISQDPGPLQYVMAAADEAKTFVRTRLAPTVENCEAVHSLIGYADISAALEMNFPGAALLVTGANSKSKLQSNPKRYLLLDEVRNYPPGAYEMVRKRVRAFWNSKVITISTPDMANDHVHRAFLHGDQRTWHFACPDCGQLQPLTFKQLKWDENDETRPNGRWNIDKAAATLRYECIGCLGAIRDTPSNRKHIASRQHGRWIRMNPSAPSNKVSFTWSALLPPWVKWRDVMEEYLLAYSALKLGDHEPFKAFVNETLGEPWEDRLKEVTDFAALEHRRAQYELGDPWPDEVTRMLAFDVQKDHFRYVCRAFDKHGGSRLVAFGRVDTEEQAEQLADFLRVKRVNVMVDSGHDTARVYRLCLRNRWKAFKGTANEYFTTKDEKDGKPLRRLFTLTHADPALGTAQQGKVAPIKLYLWANVGTKDMLALWMQGSGPNWTIPSTNSAEMNEYVSQVTAERRVERVDAKGRVSYEWIQVRRDNHYWDCELMITIAAFAVGLVGQPRPVRAAETPGPARNERTFELDAPPSLDASDTTA